MRQNKSISFNTLDPFDLGLLEHAEKINHLTGKKQNFSSYVKRLIADDMRGGANRAFLATMPAVDEIQTQTHEIIEAMNSFL